MDPLRRDSIERAIRTAPEEKARQALEMMEAAIWLRRAGLRARLLARQAQKEQGNASPRK